MIVFAEETEEETVSGTVSETNSSTSSTSSSAQNGVITYYVLLVSVILLALALLIGVARRVHNKRQK